MDVGRVGSLFIRALESFLEGNAIRLTLTFKEPLDLCRLTASFEKLVVRHPALRVRFEEGGWPLMTRREVQAALDGQVEELKTVSNPKDIHSEYHPTNAGLPMRIKVIDDNRLMFSLNHVFGNGKSAFYFIEDLLCLYGSEDGDSIPAPRPGPSRARRVVQALRGIFWTGAYLIAFIWRAGRDAGRITADLSKGKSPGTPREGFAVWTYLLTPGESESVMKRPGHAGLTVTENLCCVMATAMLDAQPEKSRVCISVPTDLGAYVPGFSPEAPGNYTGALIVQLWRDRPLEFQVRRAFRWTRRGVHYWIPWLIGQRAGSEANLSERFLRQAQRPISQRAPFENFSCAVSSVGVVQGPMTRKHLAAISAHTRTQTIFLCAITLNGSMSIEVCVSRDLFNCAEVMGVTDRAVALLTGVPTAETARKRVEV